MAQQQERIQATPLTWRSGAQAHRWRRPDGDALFKGVATLAALTVPMVALLIVGTATISAGPTLSRYGFGFLAGSQWDLIVKHLYGARPFIFGTVLTSLVALLLAGPVGVGVAL